MTMEQAQRNLVALGYQNPKLVDFRGAVQPIGDVGVIGPQRTVIRGDSLEMMFNPSGCKRCFSSRNY